VFGAEVTTRGSWLVVHVTGELDLATAPAFRQAVVGAISVDTADVVVDLTACDYLDSIGVGLLLGVLKRARTHGGRLVLVSDTPRIVRVLELTELVRIVPVVDSLARALDPELLVGRD
jgi:anti-sigma B factor antagonist